MALNRNNVYEESKAFSEWKVNKLLLKLAIPIIISQIVNELYNAVGAIFVGRAVGALAIGGLTVASPIQRLIVSIALLISVGASTAIGKSLGEGNNEKTGNILTNALTLMLVWILIVTIFVYKFKTPLIYHLGATESIFPYADNYITIVTLGSVFQCFTIMIGYIITAIGNAKVSLNATIIGAVIDIILSYILVIILAYGVKGAAISIVISQIISAVYTFYHFLKLKTKFNINLKFSLKKELVASILTVGLSTFIVEIADSVVGIILNNLLSSLGDMGIVIIGVATKVNSFMYIVMVGIALAMQPIVSYNYGAKDFIRVKEVLKKSINAVLISSLIIWIVMLAFAKQVISIFIKDQYMISQASTAFRIIIAVFPLIGVYFLVICYYQSIQDSKLACLLSIWNQLIIFIPIAIVLIRILGLTGAWIAYPLSDFLTTPITIYYIFKAYRQLDNKKKKQEFLIGNTVNQPRYKVAKKILVNIGAK